MKQKKMVKSISQVPLSIPNKSNNEISEVHALLDIVKAIKIKESDLKQKKELKEGMANVKK
jgi:hypothetical protein